MATVTAAAHHQQYPHPSSSSSNTPSSSTTAAAGRTLCDWDGAARLAVAARYRAAYPYPKPPSAAADVAVPVSTAVDPHAVIGAHASALRSHSTHSGHSAAAPLAGVPAPAPAPQPRQKLSPPAAARMALEDVAAEGLRRSAAQYQPYPNHQTTADTIPQAGIPSARAHTQATERDVLPNGHHTRSGAHTWRDDNSTVATSPAVAQTTTFQQHHQQHYPPHHEVHPLPPAAHVGSPPPPAHDDEPFTVDVVLGGVEYSVPVHARDTPQAALQRLLAMLPPDAPALTDRQRARLQAAIQSAFH